MKEYQETRDFLVRSIVRDIEFKKDRNEIHRERIKTASKTTRLSIRNDAENRTCDGISINCRNWGCKAISKCQQISMICGDCACLLWFWWER